MGTAESPFQRLDRLYRRTGATLPFGDARRSHGAEMEGYFWRVTDTRAGRVLVVLCGVNRHPDGDWATVAIAAEPGGFVRSGVLPHAHAARDALRVIAGDGAFHATDTDVHIDLGEDARADLRIDGAMPWPHALGGGGVLSAVPFLGQYWHPHLLDGLASGTAAAGGEHWNLTDAAVYGEKNWGAGFPAHWWWGQAHGFERDDVCVAFTGGVLTAGPLAATVGGVVVRVGPEVVRLTPPFALVRSHTDGTRWEVHARGWRTRVDIRATSNGDPHVLPVPVPAERRNADTDFEHLTGHLSLEVAGRLRFSGTSELAGLEVGHRPPPRDA